MTGPEASFPPPDADAAPADASPPDAASASTSPPDPASASASTPSNDPEPASAQTSSNGPDAASAYTSSPTSPGETARTPRVPPAVTWIRTPRAGELSIGWRVVTACLWVAVAGAFAAIWNTSERLGLSTWWLGPRGEPMPVFVRLLPFVAPTAMVLAVSYNATWLWRWGVLAALVTAGIGFGDLGGFSGLSGLELLVAAAALGVSLASATGTYRPAHDGDAAPPR